MLTRPNPDLLPEKTEPTPFAAKAKDLGALRDAVVDAASVGAGLWLSYLFALFYFAIAAGAVTHRDLLLESPVKLPFLNVELPLKAFFILGPLVFLIVHLYVLLHFVLLASKIGALDRELKAQISGPAFTPESSFEVTRARLRRQLPSNIFVQSLAGAREVRTGIVGFLLRRIIEISLVAGPIALLVLFQLQFLPYHNEWITMWQRIAVVTDLVLLWFLWPPIARGDAALLCLSDFRRVKVQVMVLVTLMPVLLVGTIATFPGEWLGENLPPLSFIPNPWPASDNGRRRFYGSFEIWGPPKRLISLHELLVAGPINYVTGRPRSLWSNVLVLPNFEPGDRVIFDTEGKIAISLSSVSLRGRSLEGAVLSFAHLRKADFTNAQLADSNFTGADLREAKFDCDWSYEHHYILSALSEARRPETCAQLQGADFSLAHLQGALLAGAQLQGALLAGAQLQGTNFSFAQLKDASLVGAQLQGALLNRAELQGAELAGAQLQGAILARAQLQSASLNRAQLQGASLFEAQLQGADFSLAHLQGALLAGAQLHGALLAGAQLQGASLFEAQLQGANLSSADLEGALLRHSYVWRTDPPSNSTGAFVDALELGPKYSGLDCRARECDWSGTSYATLKSLIENSASGWNLVQHQALRQIAVLEKPPYVANEASAKAWTDFAKGSARPPGSYFDNLVKTIKEIGCAVDGAPYVINNLMRPLGGAPGLFAPVVYLHQRFEGHLSHEAEIAAAFLDEAKCPAARGLSEENKAQLQEIRDRGLPAPAGPGTAAR